MMHRYAHIIWLTIYLFSPLSCNAVKQQHKNHAATIIKRKLDAALPYTIDESVVKKPSQKIDFSRLCRCAFCKIDHHKRDPKNSITP